MSSNILNIRLEPTTTWVQDLLSQHENAVVTVRDAVIDVALDDSMSKGRILIGNSQLALGTTDASEAMLYLSFVNYQYVTKNSFYINFIPDHSNTALVISFQCINQVVKDIKNTAVYSRGYSVAINTSNFGHKFFIPEKTSVNVFSVTIPRVWLKKYLNPTTDTFISQLLASPEPLFIYEIMNFSIQAAFEEILKNELNTFAEKMAFHEILSRMIRLLLVQLSHSRKSPTKHKFKQPDIEALAKTERLLLANFQEAPSIKYLASEAAMSETKYKTAFKQLYGRSVYDYYLHYRMEIAREWLVENRMSVTEVAQKLGYKNISYFSRIFKKHFGQYPSKYQ
jgi:AraC-like DNA-binding protein